MLLTIVEKLANSLIVVKSVIDLSRWEDSLGTVVAWNVLMLMTES